MSTDRPIKGSSDSDATVSRDPRGYAAHGPARISGYEILRELHSGGQGVVYLAIQQSTHRKVAVKMPHRRHDASNDALRRFEREIRIVAQFNHPNIVKVFDSGMTDDGRSYCVMEYVRGQPLTRYIRTHELTMEETLSLVRTVCDAVAHAHQRGIVHRDLKPANILVDGDGNVKVLDFGLAKPVGPAVDTVLTVTGQFVGTLRYTSPEQTRGNPDEIDARSDVYSLGVILYEILTGRSPYPDIDQLAQLAQWVRHITETPPPAPIKVWDSRLGIAPRSKTHELGRSCPIDTDLQTIVLKSLAKVRNRRYAGAADLGRDITRYLRDEPIEARADSVVYVIGAQFRRLARRHRFTTFAVLTLLSVAVASTVGTPLVFRWTSLNAWYERVVTHILPPALTADVFKNVVIVGLSDRTDIEAIAANEGIEGVTAKTLTSWRRLHGKLMERLAVSGCRTVVWDIKFRRPTEYDDGFVEGVKTLKAAGVDVVVIVPDWWGAPAVPEISGTIAPHVEFGTIWLRLSTTPYAVQLAAKRGFADPQSSFALATYAHFRRPGKNFTMHMDTKRHRIDLTYWVYDAKLPSLKQADEQHSDQIPLTRASTGQAEFPDGSYEQLGLRGSDILGLFYFDIPSDDVLAASTMDYGDVLSLGEERLRERLKDKVVMIGDLRSGKDRHALPDGRSVSACYAHAAAVDRLIRGIFVQTPRAAGEIALPLFGAVFGCIGAVAGAWRFLARVAWVFSGILLITVASAFAYGQFYYLFSPFVPALALVVAFIACMLVGRVCRTHGTI